MQWLKNVWVCVAVGLLLSFAGSAFGAEIVGRVADKSGKGISEVQLSFKDMRGRIVGGAKTDGDGAYTINGLGEGDYTATLDPAKTGYRGSTVAVHLAADQVLCLNWAVSNTAEALALAQGATSVAMCLPDPPSDAFIAAAAAGGVLVVGGIGIGAYAAAGGGFGGSSSNQPKKSVKRTGD
jgi:Carboxypeptidase regulatory-like domain